MGFFDKAMAQAQQLAVKAQDGVKTGQDKLEQAQAKRAADSMLRDLGAALYLERTGRATPETAAAVETITAELRRYEAEHEPVELRPAAPVVPVAAAPPAPPAPSVPPPPPAAPPVAAVPPAPPASPPSAPSSGFSLDDL